MLLVVGYRRLIFNIFLKILPSQFLLLTFSIRNINSKKFFKNIKNKKSCGHFCEDPCCEGAFFTFFNYKFDLYQYMAPQKPQNLESLAYKLGSYNKQSRKPIFTGKLNLEHLKWPMDVRRPIILSLYGVSGVIIEYCAHNCRYFDFRHFGTLIFVIFRLFSPLGPKNRNFPVNIGFLDYLLQDPSL